MAERKARDCEPKKKTRKEKKTKRRQANRVFMRRSFSPSFRFGNADAVFGEIGARTRRLHRRAVPTPRALPQRRRRRRRLGFDGNRTQQKRGQEQNTDARRPFDVAKNARRRRRRRRDAFIWVCVVDSGRAPYRMPGLLFRVGAERKRAIESRLPTLFYFFAFLVFFLFSFVCFGLGFFFCVMLPRRNSEPNGPMISISIADKNNSGPPIKVDRRRNSVGRGRSLAATRRSTVVDCAGRNPVRKRNNKKKPVTTQLRPTEEHRNEK